MVAIYESGLNFPKNSGSLTNLSVIDYIIREQELPGNGNINGVKKNVLNPEIRTRSIRIYPKDPLSLSTTNVKHACLRLELHGCLVHGKQFLSFVI